jgi:hypothetical protein
MTDEDRAKMKAAALVIFNDQPSETPQVVRDVIEWYDASIAEALDDASRLDSHGRYWIENRGRIIDAVTAAGFRLMSNADRCWLQPLSARVVPPVIIAANLDSTR